MFFDHYWKKRVGRLLYLIPALSCLSTANAFAMNPMSALSILAEQAPELISLAQLECKRAFGEGIVTLPWSQAFSELTAPEFDPRDFCNDLNSEELTSFIQQTLVAANNSDATGSAAPNPLSAQIRMLLSQMPSPPDLIAGIQELCLYIAGSTIVQDAVTSLTQNTFRCSNVTTVGQTVLVTLQQLVSRMPTAGPNIPQTSDSQIAQQSTGVPLNPVDSTSSAMGSGMASNSSSTLSAAPSDSSSTATEAPSPTPVGPAPTDSTGTDGLSADPAVSAANSGSRFGGLVPDFFKLLSRFKIF